MLLNLKLMGGDEFFDGVMLFNEYLEFFLVVFMEENDVLFIGFWCCRNCLIVFNFFLIMVGVFGLLFIVFWCESDFVFLFFL